MLVVVGKGHGEREGEINTGRCGEGEGTAGDRGEIDTGR